ncbi:hypothetical protein [uncultured Tolumonas sp.]|uniref:hypothetical protein n=1 Tax=uncultured Tolumonas sp. TaxID=263765 RepID=UPI00292D5D3B|nr:hypothetical protein [uncultured Tolumonas sp.]
MTSRQICIFIGGPFDGEAIAVPLESNTIKAKDQKRPDKNIQYQRTTLIVNDKPFSVFTLPDVTELQIEKVKKRWSVYFQ